MSAYDNWLTEPFEENAEAERFREWRMERIKETIEQEMAEHIEYINTHCPDEYPFINIDAFISAFVEECTEYVYDGGQLDDFVNKKLETMPTKEINEWEPFYESLNRIYREVRNAMPYVTGTSDLINDAEVRCEIETLISKIVDDINGNN